MRISKGFCVSREKMVNGHILDVDYFLGVFLSGNSLRAVYFSLSNKTFANSHCVVLLFLLYDFTSIFLASENRS